MLAPLTASAQNATAGADFIGIEPLTERTTTYEGLGEPGLYPGGSNNPTGDHLAYGEAKTAEITPLDANGNPDPDGWIGLMLFGVSNAAQEWSVFERTVDGASRHDPQVIIAPTGASAKSVGNFVDPLDNSWEIVEKRLTATGLTPEQVQVVWFKQAPSSQEVDPTAPFPDEALELKDNMQTVIGNLIDKYPNVKVIYLSSRIYAGHSTLNPGEPFAYETAFSVKWLIEEQINGHPDLVDGPWLAWGPYLWADGTNARTDGLTWLLEDFEGDGRHPSPQGEVKAAREIHRFFARDPLAKTWYLPQGTHRMTSIRAEEDTWTNPDLPDENYSTKQVMRAVPGGGAYVKFDITRVPGSLAHGKLIYRSLTQVATSQLHVGTDSTWSEATLTFNNAPGWDPTPIHSEITAGRQVSLSFDVTQQLLDAKASGETEITFVFTSEEAEPKSPTLLTSNAVSEGPMLVLVAPENRTSGSVR